MKKQRELESTRGAEEHQKKWEEEERRRVQSRGGKKYETHRGLGKEEEERETDRLKKRKRNIHWLLQKQREIADLQALIEKILGERRAREKSGRWAEKERRRKFTRNIMNPNSNPNP
jgi:hypothetical protein